MFDLIYYNATETISIRFETIDKVKEYLKNRQDRDKYTANVTVYAVKDQIRLT